MRLFYKYILIFFVFISESNLRCQIEFDSEYLNYLYSSLPPANRLIVTDTANLKELTISASDIWGGEKIEIKYSLFKNRLIDLGAELINSVGRKAINSELITRFVEREMLEYALIVKTGTLTGKMSENNITLILNGGQVNDLSALKKAYGIITGSTGIVKKENGMQCCLIWTNKNSDSLAFTFPLRYTLIRNKDKKELDEELQKQIQKYRCSEQEKDPYSLVYTSGTQISQHDSIYCRTGKYFFIKEFSNSTYYRIKNGKSEFLFQPGYLKESVSNLTQHPQLNEKLFAKIQHKTYGKTELNYVLRLCDLLDYFKKNGEIYTALEPKGTESYKATIICSNREMNVIHIITMELYSENLFGNNEYVNVNLRTNIPIDNDIDLHSAVRVNNY